MKPHIATLTLIGAAFAATFVSSQAATIAQTNLNANDSNLWNNPAVWGGTTVGLGNDYSQVAGGASIGTSFSVGSTVWSFNSNLRDTNGGTPASTTFAGDSLINNVGTRLLLKGNNNTTSTASIVLNGGHITLAPNAGGAGAAGTTNLAGSILASAGTVSAIGVLPVGGTTNTLNVTSTITGSGTIQLVTTGGTSRTAFLNVTGNISGFSGTFYLSTNTGATDGGAASASSAFSFASATATAATLNLATDSARFLFNLNSDLTFGTVIVGTSTLTPGTYDYDDLNTIAPGKFLTGSGTITVIPEPSVSILFGAMAVGCTVGIRRRGLSSRR